MTHIATGDDGNAAAGCAGGGGDGFAERDQPGVGAIGQAENDGGAGPAGLGEEPKRHKRAMIQGLVADHPGCQAAFPGLRDDLAGERGVVGKAYLHAGGVKLGECALETLSSPDAEGSRPAGRVGRNQHERFGLRGYDAGRRRAHGASAGLRGGGSVADDIRDEDGGVGHQDGAHRRGVIFRR